MTDPRVSISAIIGEIEQNPMARIATDPDDCEAYEIARRIMRRIDRSRAGITETAQISTKVE
jgi:hypothetical protein